MKKLTFIAIALVVLQGCKKFDAEPTYAKREIAATWAKNQPFYQPKGERYIDSSNRWVVFRAFTFTSDTDPDKLSFANPYVPGKGTNALDMTRMYSAEKLTSDSGYYNITLPKIFQFIPDEKDPTVGQVVVREQDVTIYRTDKSSFVIHLSPGSAPGSYNTMTGVFEIEVAFDESSIGGPSRIIRKYRFTA